MVNFDYDRPGRVRQYTSIQKHRHNANNNHNKWKNYSLEKETFDNADYGAFNKVVKQSWVDSKLNLWGFVEGFCVLGTQSEQFGFFPVTQNNIDRWHGYPIIPFIKDYEINQELLHRWVEEGYLDEDDIHKLRKRKRIR